MGATVSVDLGDWVDATVVDWGKADGPLQPASSSIATAETATSVRLDQCVVTIVQMRIS